MRIACALCVGATREPYLAATLASIADVVDVLVVNDNSGEARSENLAILEASAFAARGALRVRAQPFVDFADMRNRAFAQLRELDPAPDWVLFLDADEVHGAQLATIARGLLPKLSCEVGHLDAYTYHFWATPRWISDVARRLVFYRYAPDLRWSNAVHEKLDNLAGGPFVIAYTYHHYGNVLPPSLLARKHGRYFELGNPVPRPPSEGDAGDEIYVAKARLVRPYAKPHPREARATLAALEHEFGADFARLDAEIAARQGAADRLAAAGRGALERLRVELRRVEHPGAYREATRAR